MVSKKQARVITDSISDNARRLVKDPGFKSWLSTEKLEEGDLVVVNNSFVYRDVNTVKSADCLCFKVGAGKELDSPPEVLSGFRFNVDFKRLSLRAGNLPRPQGLDDAVERQVSELGQLVFILLGEVSDTVTIREPLTHSFFDEVVWDPTASKLVSCANNVTVKETHDEEAVWAEIESYFKSDGNDPPDGLREAIGVALDRLQLRAVAKLNLPGGSVSAGCVTDAIVRVLQEQQKEYDSALDRFVRNSTDSVALNNMLRIAYNFSSDATTFLRLIVSVCDLKPIVLWGTIAEHYRLSQEFSSLPWTRSRQKPSLKSYIATIADARNSAFHNLFPFRKSLQVALPDVALQDPELWLFSEHGRKGDNRLTYRDKELVDVLVEFTRARERRVPLQFWKQNSNVIESTIKLFAGAGSFLTTLHAAGKRIGTV